MFYWHNALAGGNQRTRIREKTLEFSSTVLYTLSPYLCKCNEQSLKLEQGAQLSRRRQQRPLSAETCQLLLNCMKMTFKMGVYVAVPLRIKVLYRSPLLESIPSSNSRRRPCHAQYNFRLPQQHACIQQRRAAAGWDRQTDGRTPDSCTNPALHTMRGSAVPITQPSNLHV